MLIEDTIVNDDSCYSSSIARVFVKRFSYRQRNGSFRRWKENHTSVILVFNMSVILLREKKQAGSGIVCFLNFFLSSSSVPFRSYVTSKSRVRLYQINENSELMLI